MITDMLSRVQMKIENKVDAALLGNPPSPVNLSWATSLAGSQVSWEPAELSRELTSWSNYSEGSPGDGCQPGCAQAAGGAGLSPSGASQEKAEGACASRNGAAQLVLSFVTQKRDGECTKAGPREAQWFAHMENTRKGLGRGRNDEGSPGYI